jgi:hypothetical protein
MADLQIEGELATTLYELAAHENVSVEALLHTLIEHYHSEKRSDVTTAMSNEGSQAEALDKFIGMFDDDVSDLSASVSDTVTEAIKKKHARFS